MDRAGWLRSNKPLDMLRAFRGKAGRRRRLFACACLRHCVALFPHEAVLAALRVSELHTDGFASASELEEACDVVRGLMDDHGQGVEAQVLYATWTCASAEVDFAARRCFVHASLAHVVGKPAVWSEGMDMPELADSARDIFPYRRKTRSDPKFQTTDVKTLADRAYSDRLEDGTLDPFTLLAVADALEEAGFADEAALHHLRGLRDLGGAVFARSPEGSGRSPRHFRGCWAVDLARGVR